MGTGIRFALLHQPVVHELSITSPPVIAGDVIVGERKALATFYIQNPSYSPIHTIFLLAFITIFEQLLDGFLFRTLLCVVMFFCFY